MSILFLLNRNLDLIKDANFLLKQKAMLMPVFTPVKHMRRNRRPKKVQEGLKKGMSIPTLMRGMSRMVDMNNSKYVKPYKVEKLVDGQGKSVFRCFTRTDDPRFPPERDHSPNIRPLDIKYKGPITKCPAVVAECTCARWPFMWEYANAVRGNGEIWRGNGDPPDINNPRLKPGLCKHLIVLCKWLMLRKL